MRSKNQKNRDRLARRREELRNEINYYTKHTFNPEEQEQIDHRIAVLQRELDRNGVPNTYR